MPSYYWSKSSGAEPIYHWSPSCDIGMLISPMNRVSALDHPPPWKKDSPNMASAILDPEVSKESSQVQEYHFLIIRIGPIWSSRQPNIGLAHILRKAMQPQMLLGTLLDRSNSQN